LSIFTYRKKIIKRWALHFKEQSSLIIYSSEIVKKTNGWSELEFLKSLWGLGTEEE
jgi:hypothetical protein